MLATTVNFSERYVACAVIVRQVNWDYDSLSYPRLQFASSEWMCWVSG